MSKDFVSDFYDNRFLLNEGDKIKKLNESSLLAGLRYI
jgi:hypothetical protein